jgi:hypothetical protein
MVGACNKYLQNSGCRTWQEITWKTVTQMEDNIKIDIKILDLNWIALVQVELL